VGTIEHPFKIGDEVVIAASGERGEVIGLAVFARSEASAQLRYKAADGRAVESWWQVSALELSSAA
jgi:hypothetical protein